MMMVEWRTLGGEARARLCMAFASAEWPIISRCSRAIIVFCERRRQRRRISHSCGRNSAGIDGLTARNGSAAGKAHLLVMQFYVLTSQCSNVPYPYCEKRGPSRGEFIGRTIRG